MKALPRLIEDRSWNVRKKFRQWFHFMVCLHDDCRKAFKKKNNIINLAIVDYTINRWNRQAPDDLHEAQRDGQTRKARCLF